jgi:hypothetical protein
MKDIAKLEDLTPDQFNANEGTLRGAQLLGRSLEQHGAARPIVVDRNGIVAAGNKALEAAVERGLSARVVQTNGRTLVVVQRMDLDLSDPKTRELAYLDNRASEVGLKWSPTQLEADLARGIELGNMFTDDEREDLLRMLDQAEVTTKFHFDTMEQLAQFLVLVEHVTQHYAGETFGAKLTQWSLEQLASLDPMFQATAQ